METSLESSNFGTVGTGRSVLSLDASVEEAVFAMNVQKEVVNRLTDEG